MTLALIAAAAGQNLVIGKNGDIPWHFPSDFKMFKQRTTGHRVIMGRVTYDSILRKLGKPLPNRTHIVVTRDKSFQDERVTVIHDISDIHQMVRFDETVYIIGGEQIYRQTLPLADFVYLTHIDSNIEGGDAFFPTLDKKQWSLIEERPLTENGTNLRFCVYKRVSSC